MGAPTDPCDQPKVEKQIELVNSVRTRNGLQKVSCDPLLTRLARKHSHSQCQRNKMTHEGPNGSQFVGRYKQAGVKFDTGAENVARGQPTAALVHRSWMNSRRHKRNIMHPAFTRLGVGYVECEEGRGPYWTQNFAGPPVEGGAQEVTISRRKKGGQASSVYCEPAAPPANVGVRMAAEAGGWILGGGVGMLVGGASAAEFASENPEINRQGWVLFGGATGLALVGSLGTYIGGDELRANGMITPTVGGGVLMTTLGAILISPYEGRVDEVATVAAMGMGGAILSYELSHFIKSAGGGRQAAGPPTRITPAVGYNQPADAPTFGFSVLY
jgi:hypothetical protein